MSLRRKRARPSQRKVSEVDGFAFMGGGVAGGLEIFWIPPSAFSVFSVVKILLAASWPSGE